MIFLSTKAGIFESITAASASPPSSPTKPGSTRSSYEHGSKTTLAIITASGLVAVYAHSGSISVIALGLSYAALEALALNLVERARDQPRDVGGVIYSANGFLTQPVKPMASGTDQWTALSRDVSAAAGVSLGLAALSLESLRFGGLAYYGLLGQAMGDHWVFGQSILSVVYALGTVVVHVVMSGTMLLMVSVPCSCRLALATFFVAFAPSSCSNARHGPQYKVLTTSDLNFGHLVQATLPAEHDWLMR